MRFLVQTRGYPANRGRIIATNLLIRCGHQLLTISAIQMLEVLKLRRGLGHFRLRAPLYLIGLKAMHQELAQFTAQHQVLSIQPLLPGVVFPRRCRLVLSWKPVAVSGARRYLPAP